MACNVCVLKWAIQVVFVCRLTAILTHVVFLVQLDAPFVNGQYKWCSFVLPQTLTCCLVISTQLDAPFVNGQYKWWEEAELRDLCTSVGLQVSSRLELVLRKCMAVD